MGREKKQSESEESPGAPEWMVTFSDCMTLLLTFFVLLLSFSSFDENVFEELKSIFFGAMPYVGRRSSKNQESKDAFLATKLIDSSQNLLEGSEKPTLARGGEENLLKEETEPVNFHSRKVFLISSKKVFWGKGTAISLQGRRTLSAMASFLKEVPSRVVISENGPEGDNNSRNFGLPRAWAAMEYLATEKGLDKKQFSLSATSTLTQESFKGGELDRLRPEVERVLEIVLLERSIYN
ncbi:MAG: flagellar motor protein MotB [Planctomycetota bacterium]|jgi:chemotaxis protein MotB